MQKEDILFVIDEFKQWADAPGDNGILSAETLADLSMFISKAVYDHDYAALTIFRSQLTPLTVKLRTWLDEVPRPERQGVEVSVLNALVNTILGIMEHDDPVQAASLITHGSVVLGILTDLDLDGVKIKTIIENWPEGSDRAPSIATISRTLGALEEGLFLQRRGFTKGRTIHLMPKARSWMKATGRKPAPKKEKDNVLPFPANDKKEDDGPNMVEHPFRQKVREYC